MVNKFETVRNKLKEEFFGIDNAIDEVVNGFKLWETIKDYQTRPIIYNLWGLTGCGKTALINKCIEYLKLEHLTTNIKLNSKIDMLSEELSDNDLPQNIFVIDEFQHARTINDNGHEIARKQDGELNIIWDLFDSGKITMFGNSKSNIKYSVNVDIDRLKQLDECGAKYENGVIYHPNLHSKLSQLFVDNFDTEDAIIRKKMGFIGDDNNWRISIKEGILSGEMIEDILKVQPSLNPKNNDNGEPIISKTEIILNTLLRTYVRDIYDIIDDCGLMPEINSYEMMTLYMDKLPDINSIIIFLESLKKTKPKPKIKDFSQSLIFVMGNLDECYGIANELNSDLDADYFHKETKKINITDVKESLLNRFRAEEIARLGSKHIIYPSLNKNAFKAIINKELVRFTNTVISKFESHKNKIGEVLYSENIHKIIYLEGVFPIQGTRSVFSVINDVVIDKFPTVIEYILSLDNDNSIISYDKLTLFYDYNFRRKVISTTILNGDDIIVSYEFDYVTQISDLRTENTSKGRQVHRAVHESGHAVCSLLNNTIPEVIYSVLLGDNDGGFNLFDKSYYYRINNYANYIAMSLGGYAAEELVFGKENVSNGSSSDLASATAQLMELYKECGFYDGMIGKYGSDKIVTTFGQDQNTTITEDKFNDIVQNKINECYDIAKEYLKKQNVLFMKMSEYLTKNPKMDQKTIKKYVSKFAVDFNIKQLTDDKEQFYVDLFQEKLKLVK